MRTKRPATRSDAEVDAAERRPRVAAELRTLGIDVCARTVARLLKTTGLFRVNSRMNPPGSRRYASGAVDTPMISVETKKKELVSRMPAPSGTASPNW